MDVVRRQLMQQTWNLTNCVSILVLMDVVRRPIISDRLSGDWIVSILVLMDVVRRQAVSDLINANCSGLNPCFNGYSTPTEVT